MSARSGRPEARPVTPVSSVPSSLFDVPAENRELVSRFFETHDGGDVYSSLGGRFGIDSRFDGATVSKVLDRMDESVVADAVEYEDFDTGEFYEEFRAAIAKELRVDDDDSYDSDALIRDALRDRRTSDDASDLVGTVHLESYEGTSNKFYEVTVSGSPGKRTVEYYYGSNDRPDSGTRKVAATDVSDAEASKLARGQVRAKKKRGYEDFG